MYKITPTTELIFELVNKNKSDLISKLLILGSILKNVFLWFLGYVIALILTMGLLRSIGDENAQHMYALFCALVFTLMTFASVYYIGKKYALSIKLYKYSVEHFDRNFNEIGDDSDTTMSGYMIDYLCIESSIFDAQTIEIKNQRPINYGKVRSQILQCWNKNKSPNVPFHSEGYSNYMHILRHLLHNNPVSLNTFRELYKQTIY